ncbi:glycosyltransferase family 4 protein [Azospirillum halopraeferens]|uniref:glycosyltransferase family 4 protein n=1 Tax=Azospirillum halopraeferens TaxID=34010 RepID=UPI0004061DAF|nr:glycosyltransferase family 4 protein [Azospirillum halopraeferens]
MRVLLLSRYARLGSSSRLRYYQFLPELAERGIEVDVSPLLPDAYLAALYEKGARPMELAARSYVTRILSMLTIRRYDLLWIEKELLPWLPFGIERMLLAWGPPYVIDYDDAWFHVYDSHPSALVRAALGTKLDRIMRGAALVTVGNAYLAARALAAGARRVEVFPTVVNLARYGEPSPADVDDRLTVGWIGSPVTARYLDLVRSPLHRLCGEGQIRIVLVGANDNSVPDLAAERPGWREDTEVEEIRAFDVGIMPLSNTRWERGKCGYKLIQYMACGKPVIASPVGVNREIVEHGVNGFLAETPEEWYEAVVALGRDAALRRTMGLAGRRKVEHDYSLQGLLPRLAAALDAAASSARP